MVPTYHLLTLNLSAVLIALNHLQAMQPIIFVDDQKRLNHLREHN